MFLKCKWMYVVILGVDSQSWERQGARQPALQGWRYETTLLELPSYVEILF